MYKIIHHLITIDFAGVSDESRSLKYGQVYVNIKGVVKVGPVMVCKAPALYPGDMRILSACNAPALEKLENVIVFPIDGPRPHSNEISGSK